MNYCGLCRKYAEKMFDSIHVCCRCYKKLEILKGGDLESILYYEDKNNLKRASDEMKKCISNMLDNVRYVKDNASENDIKRAIWGIEFDKKQEKHKRAHHDRAEYTVVTVSDFEEGVSDTLNEILFQYKPEGWILSSAFPRGESIILILER